MTLDHAVVIGGGISGLTAAWELVNTTKALAVTVLEASERLGGVIKTGEIAGREIDAGPDSFVARRPEATDLCEQLALTGELLAPATGQAYVFSRGRLAALPSGLVLGVPSELGPLLRTRAISPLGRLRAGLDLLKRSNPSTADESVGSIVRTRLGAEVAERLADPLIGGINAGRTDMLSAAVVAPQLHAARRAGGSLMRALRAQRPPEDGKRPVFLAPRSGMRTIVDALAKAVRLRGVEVRVDGPAQGIERRGDRWIVEGGGAREADAVVVATPAHVAARLVRQVVPLAADVLETIRHASVALIQVAAIEGEKPLPAGSGFLVPAVEGRLLTACTFFTQKWPHLARPGETLLRLSAGRDGDTRADELDDGALTAGLLSDVAAALGQEITPASVRVTRWPRAFPQFDVGHKKRIATLETELAGSRLAVCGPYMSGVGIPACIASARRAVASLG